MKCFQWHKLEENTDLFAETTEIMEYSCFCNNSNGLAFIVSGVWIYLGVWIVICVFKTNSVEYLTKPKLLWKYNTCNNVCIKYVHVKMHVRVKILSWKSCFYTKMWVFRAAIRKCYITSRCPNFLYGFTSDCCSTIGFGGLSLLVFFGGFSASKRFADLRSAYLFSFQITFGGLFYRRRPEEICVELKLHLYFLYRRCFAAKRTCDCLRQS